MDSQRFLFVVAIPPGSEKDLRANRVPEIQVSIDATTTEQPGIVAGFISNMQGKEIARFAAGAELFDKPAIDLVLCSAFNPNRDTVPFASVVALIGQIM